MRFVTKQKILYAFNELMQTDVFPEITISQIAQKAGVSHATFYRYFKDKYEVMNANFARLAEADLDPDSGQLQDYFRTLLIEGKKYYTPLIGQFSMQGCDILHRFISDYVFSFAKNLYETWEPYTYLSDDEVILLKISCYGISHFYQEWLKGNYDIPASQAADAMYAVLPSFLHDPLRKES